MTIAAALQRRRRPVYFLADLEPASLAMSLKRGGSDWIGMHNPVGAPADLAQVQKEMNRLHPAAILVDSPLATKSYLQELVAAGTMVISVDHQAAIRLRVAHRRQSAARPEMGQLRVRAVGPAPDGIALRPGSSRDSPASARRAVARSRLRFSVAEGRA